MIFVPLKKIAQMNILRLKEILIEKGVAGKDLAEKIGATPNTISNIVQGNNFPKPETLLAIASALDVDIKELFVSTKAKETSSEPLYIKRDGELVKIGEIDLHK